MCVCGVQFRSFVHSLILVNKIVWLLCEGSACRVAGTMHGKYLNKDFNVVGRPYCSDPNVYIFVVREQHFYKMTAVSLDNAKASTEPSTPVDKYIQSSKIIDVDDSATLCKMWDGDGYTTKTNYYGNGYELKDVTVSGSGCGLYIHICPYMPVTHEVLHCTVRNLINIYMNTCI